MKTTGWLNTKRLLGPLEIFILPLVNLNQSIIVYHNHLK